MRKSRPKRRNRVAADLRTPKYQQRIVTDKRRRASKRACRVTKGSNHP